jgi:hypothetical protein
MNARCVYRKLKHGRSGDEVRQAIASRIDPTKLAVRTILNGEERQSYPISDMIFQRAETCQQNLARRASDPMN